MRITSLNFFAENIDPKWEDPHNKKGHTLSLQYEIRNKADFEPFFNALQQNWEDLILLVVGGSLVGSEFVILYILFYLDLLYLHIVFHLSKINI